jgi:anion-transporting  ArsA/GET3 family ATPase
VDKDDDKVYGKLRSIRARLAALTTLFSKESFISVIVNPDELSVFEALRIKEELTRLKIPVSAICINKQGVSDAAWAQNQELAELPQFQFDFSREGISTREDLATIGVVALTQHFLKEGK